MGLGGMMVRADRARDVITAPREFAQRVWQAIDTRDEVRNILLAAAVPEAEHKSWVEHDPGNSMSMSMSMPHVLIAPEQPLRARRADLDQPGTLDRLHAELRRAFELAGAVQQRNTAGVLTPPSGRRTRGRRPAGQLGERFIRSVGCTPYRSGSGVAPSPGGT